MIARTIAVPTHGRYLVVPPVGSTPAAMLVGFHGYAESAELHCERLQNIPGSTQWLIVSVQGLHRFYRGRTNDVVASWMTNQDREHAIADNIAYVGAVLEAVSREWSVGASLVFCGFSQGVATAFRAAAASTRAATGLIAVGGDVPPELDAAALGSIQAALVGRGSRDEWYSAEHFAADLDRLRGAGIDVQALEFDGGHEWSLEFSAAAAAFLELTRR